MTWHVTDVSEVENDGEAGVFEVLLFNGYTDQARSVLVVYTLETDKFKTHTVLTQEQLNALEDDAEMKDDIREAVKAERDCRWEARAELARKEKQAEAQTRAAQDNKRFSLN